VRLRNILFVCNRISCNYASSAAMLSYAVTRTAVTRLLVLGVRFWRRKGEVVSQCYGAGTLVRLASRTDVAHKQAAFCTASQNVLTAPDLPDP
jgi:hypothetical protein